jgi:hypothetical protein
MCALCGALVKSHWAEEGAGRRGRAPRVRLLNRVLDHFGLQLTDWAGRLYVVRDRKGRATVVDDVGMVWPAAEALLGRKLDPLEPGLVASLSPPR